MSAKHDGFKDFVLDQLHDVGGLACRAMFGGYGLSCRGTFFGIIHKDRLYFKVSLTTIASYHERNMKPLQVTKTMRLKTYYEVPIDVLEDRDILARWAEEAFLHAQEATRSRRARTKRAT